MMNRIELKKLIHSKSGNGVEFGNPNSAPSLTDIRAVEDYFGIRLPPSYHWFLSSYGGGEIYGNEIYSIYGAPSEDIIGGDIVSQYKSHTRNNTITSEEIPILYTDYGEFFVFDMSEVKEDNEIPIYLKLGEKKELYAENFYQFLEKQLSQY